MTRPAVRPRRPPVSAWLLAAVLALPGPAAAAPQAEAWTLANGLRVLFIPAPGAPMTACVALVGVGSADEKAHMHGAAHLLEHLLFNGTGALTQEQLYARIDSLGAYANAATRKDFTMFQMLAPRDQAPQAADLLAQMLFASTLPRVAFEKEKGIVLEELRTGVGPGEQVQRVADAVLLGGTPFARSAIGTEAEIRAIDRADVETFYARGYVPRNVTLVVMGAGAAADARPWIDAAFGRGERAPHVRVIPKRPAWPVEGAWSTAPAPDERWRLVARYPAPAPGDPLYPAAVVLAAALDRRLIRMPDLPPLDELAASLDVGRWFTHLVISVPFPLAEPYDALFAWRRAARTLADGIPADLDLAPVRAHLAFEDASLRDRPHYYPFFRGPEFLLRPSPATVALPDAAAQVNVAAVRAAARTIFGGAHAAVVLVPDGETRAITPPPLQKLPDPPVPTEPPPPAQREVSETWPNGLAFQARQEPGLRVGAIHVLVEGRSAREPAGQAGIAALVHRCLLGGTRDRDETALTQALTAMGARLKTHDDPNIPYDDYSLSSAYSYLRVEVVSEHVPDALALLSDVLAHAAYPDDIVHRERELLVRDASNAMDSPARRARGMLAEALFGAGTPLARPPLGVPQDIAQLTAADLRAFHPTYFAPGALRVTVVSGLPAARVRDVARAVLGGAPGAAADSTPARAPVPAAAGRRIDGESGRPQGHLLLGQRVEVAPEERAAALVATAYLSSRMQRVLREEHGWAYSVGAGMQWSTPAPVWTATFTGAAAHLDDAERVVREEVARLQTDMVATADLMRMANSLRGRQQMRRLSAINRAFYWAMRARRGADPAMLPADVVESGSVGPARVRRAAEELWQPERWVVIRLAGDG